MDQDILKYVAAAVDTSSYITIRIIKGYYVSSVRLRRSSRDFLDLVRLHFGGSPGTSVKDNVPTYWLNFDGKRAAEFLQKIYPYLRRKHGHAQMVFALNEEIQDHKKRSGRGKKLTEEELDRRYVIYERMQAFNHVPVISGHPPEVKKEDPTPTPPDLDFLL